MEQAVTLDRVTKSFSGHVAVRGLSLQVPTGSIYGFIGPNGSGKTTTLRMIMRIFHPDEGTIEVLGEHALGAATDQVAYLPEERGLYKQMKVRDVLRFYAELKGCRDSKGPIADWLDRLGLADWADKKVEALSKGMAQKVQFIATVIFSTHDMSVAEKMCDFIFMIYQGSKVLDGTLASILDAHGADTLRVHLDGYNGTLSDLPGVAKATEFGPWQELRLSPGADSQEILRRLTERGRVRHFEIARPSLHDIFVRIARPTTQGAEPNA